MIIPQRWLQLCQLGFGHDVQLSALSSEYHLQDIKLSRVSLLSQLQISAQVLK
jgi:hypothetical protein